MKSDIFILLLTKICLITQINFTVASFFINYDNAKHYVSLVLAHYKQKRYEQQNYDPLNFFLIKKRKNFLQNNVNFVYLATPKQLVSLARQNGEIKRESFNKLLPKINDDEERMKLYAKYFSQCSITNHKNSITDILTNNIITKDIFKNDQIQILNTSVQTLSQAIGLDPVSSKLFNVSPPLLENTIRQACLKNELQFQCAYAFLNDLEKIQDHINQMKKSDGNFKVMLENECKNVETNKSKNTKIDAKNSIYACFNKNANEIMNQCLSSIHAYNKTRIDVNQKMQNIYEKTMTTIEFHVAKALEKKDSKILDEIINKGEVLVKNTLTKLIKIESFKCRLYTMMEQCLTESIKSQCSNHVANLLKTILRVNYLERERGQLLDEQLLEAQLPADQECKRFANVEEMDNCTSKCDEELN